ncbi:dicarboxylate/amino acid:cation symporter [soil metagenome]
MESTDQPRVGGNFYTRIPLYVRIMIGLAIGVIVGVILLNATADHDHPPHWVSLAVVSMNETAKLLLRLLNMIAPPLILVAVIRAIITADIKGRQAGRLIFLLILNTLVAIGIGLLVANVIRPGKHAHLDPGPAPVKSDAVSQFLDNVPRSFIGPFGDNPNTIGVILIAVGVGLVVRKMDRSRIDSVDRATSIVFDIIVGLLHWIIQLVPLAVLAKVGAIIAKEGFAPFKALAWFVLAVMAALFLQACYYLIRIRIGSWIRPVKLIRGTSDALLLAFSTGSSTAAMPVTYECLYKNVGLRPQSASMGALVGSNFNNDGTALYEAMCALFIAQMIGQDLSFGHQLVVVLLSVVAAVGAAGIPEAGLVTMTLVFNAVNLPIGYIPLLLPVDWFLDRCRTAINVMGDINVSCLLDGKTQAKPDPEP